LSTVLGRRVAAALIVAIVAIGSAHAQVAVIVNANNPIGDVTLDELERLYSGRQTAFANGLQVALGEYKPARRLFYGKVLQMTETAVSRHWISVVFSERNATPPRGFQSPDDARRFVVANLGAICFIDLVSVSDDVKVVTIDGRDPRDPKYALR